MKPTNKFQKALIEGFMAYEDNMALDGNPYSADVDEWICWRRGWSVAFETDEGGQSETVEV